MSTVKFVYRSQNIPDTAPIKGSNKTITSDAVYTAINNIQMDTLFKSGHLPEGVASVVPQHNLTFSDNTLSLEKGSYVFIPAGIENGEFQFHKVSFAIDLTNTSSYSTNMDAFVFADIKNLKLVCRTKRANTISAATGAPLDSTVQQVWAQTTEPTVAQSVTSDGCIWWDLTNNVIKVYKYATSAWEEVEYSIPLGIITSLNNKITGIQQDFLLGGFCGNVTWVNPGVSFVIPTGINKENKTYNNEVLETTDVISKVILRDNVEFTDYALYMSIDGEIEGPVEEYTFDNDKGMFVDANAELHEACRYALMTAKHLTTATRDPLTCTAFTIRPIMALADNDDIDYVVRLLGSSMGLTIDDLEKEIKVATADRALLRKQIKTWLEDLKATLKDDLHHSITHKQMPVKKYFVDNKDNKHEYVISGSDVGFYTETDENPLIFVALTYDKTTDKYSDKDNNVYTLSIEEQVTSILTPDIAVDETIYGTKIFKNTIIGNITGTAQHVDISQSAGELIPLGLSAYNNDNANDIKSADTTVRITPISVKATKFEGTCTTAFWADLAEMYETDENYEVGTLLKWGGEKELTLANYGVANAVVSEKPAFLMNAEGKGQPIALVGRVRVRVLGKVKKHDAIVLNEMVPGVGKVQENVAENIIARALEDNDFVGEKLVLCAVRFSL